MNYEWLIIFFSTTKNGFWVHRNPLVEEEKRNIEEKSEKYFVVSEFSATFALAKRKGAIAQLVEQRTENPCVPGSIPGGTTKKRVDVALFFFLVYWRARVVTSCL